MYNPNANAILASHAMPNHNADMATYSIALNLDSFTAIIRFLPNN